jgi:hypothetical protein
MFSPFILGRTAAPDHDSSRAIRQCRGFVMHRFAQHGDRDLNAQLQDKSMTPVNGR